MTEKKHIVSTAFPPHISPGLQSSGKTTWDKTTFWSQQGFM